MLIEYHRTLLADKVRNEAFRRALAQVVKKGSVVADIGSGTGLMAFLAGKCGAKEIYCYEFGGVIELAKKLAKDNKIKNCHFIKAHSTEVDDPPLADVIVSETLGNYALEEHIISTIEDAKRFLKPGGTIIPGKITQYLCPVISDRYHKELCVWDDVGFDLDYSAAKEMSLNNIYVRTFLETDLLDGGNAAQVWDTVDFSKKNSSSRKGEGAWTAAKNITVYGFATWWVCELVPGIEISTSPLAPKTHWEQLYFPLLEPLPVAKGQAVSAALSSDTTHEQGTVIAWKAGVNGAKKQSLSLAKGYLDS